MPSSIRSLSAAAACMFALMLCGCGNSTSPTANGGPSASDLQGMETGFFNSMIASSNSGLSDIGASRSLLSQTSLTPKSLSGSGGCTIPSGGLTTSLCNIQVSGTDASECAGGYLSVSASLTGSLNLVGSGVSNLTFSETVSPLNCVMAGWTVNADPHVSMIATMTITGTTSSISGTGPSGGWTAVQNGVTASCLVQTPPSFNASGAHGAIGSSTLVCNGVAVTVPGHSY